MTKSTLFGIALAALLFGGCSGYIRSTSDARRDFGAERFREAANDYSGRIEGEKGKRDYLLVLLDSATAYHSAGDYQKSNDLFLEAAKLTEQLDGISIGSEAAAFLATDNVLYYKGEDFEKVQVHVYLALNFLMLGQYESALVEAKKVNTLIKYLSSEDPDKKYIENPWAIYLSGLIYETMGQINDAYIDYKRVYQLRPTFPYLGEKLIQYSKQLRFADELEVWQKRFGGSAARAEAPDDAGELVVIYESGIGPEKYQSQRFVAVAKYQPRSYRLNGLEVEVIGGPRTKTAVVEDVEKTSMDWLNSEIDRMIAKQVASSATKAAVAVGVGQATKSPLVQNALLILAYATNEADLRAWLTLPATFQLARIPLPPGDYQVRLSPIDRLNRFAGAPIGRKVTITPGKKSFITLRTSR